MLSESLSNSAFLAGRKHQIRELEKKLNSRIHSLRYSEAAAKRLCQEEKEKEFRIAREELENFLTQELGGKLY